MKKVLFLVFLVFFSVGVFSEPTHFNEIDSSVLTMHSQISKTDIAIAMNNATKYYPIIEDYSELFGVDADLIRAVIQVESSFDPNAIGDDRVSLGLMQISKDNLKVLIGSDWEEKWMLPEENIKAGTKFFKELETEVNDLGCKKEELDKILPAAGTAKAIWRNALTIAAYNSGSDDVSCDEIKAGTTREIHVPKVLAWYRIFKENYSMGPTPTDSAFYYDESGKVEIDRDIAADTISNTLYSNFLDTSFLNSLQSNWTEEYYFNPSSKKTVLMNIPEGRAYRIIKNENEFSPYWIAVKDVGSSGLKGVEVSIGFVPKMTYIWYLGSKNYPFIEFDCDTGFLSDSAIELSVGEKKTCKIVTVELISVNEDNTVSLEIEYNETEAIESIPLARKESPREFYFEELKKTFRLEGYPIFVFFYDIIEQDSKGVPSLEFSFLPDRYLSEALIDNSDILVSFGLGDNKIVFSVNESINVLKKPPVQEASLPKPKEEVLLEVFVGGEIFDYLKEGKISASVFNEKIQGFPLSLNENKKTLEGTVPKGLYYLNLRPKDPRFKEWVSENFLVELNPTQIMIPVDVDIKRDTATVKVEMPEKVKEALDSVGVTPKVEIEGKEVEVPFTTVKLGTPYYDWFFDSIVGEEFKIGIPETTVTEPWVWTDTVEEGTTIKVPEEIVKDKVIKPKDKFEVTFLIGEKNFELLEKEGWSVIHFVELSGKKEFVSIYHDYKSRDRFTAELNKGSTYNLIIDESKNTSYYNYINDEVMYYNPLYGLISPSFGLVSKPREPIDETDSEIDLRHVFFGAGESAFLEGKGEEILKEALALEGEPVTGKIKDLQIYSVNDFTCDQKEMVCEENKIPHIVFLEKGTEQVRIILEEYLNDKTGFFSIGEKGKVKIPSTAKPLDYSPTESIFFDFSEVKNGKTFSIPAYPESGDVRIVINNWDESTFQFYVCQDKTGDGKCDLYYENETEKHGATFVEPNYEAASIEVQMRQGETAEVEVELDYEGICPEEVGICPGFDKDKVEKEAIDKILDWFKDKGADFWIWYYTDGPDGDKDKLVAEGIKETDSIPLGPITVVVDTTEGMKEFVFIPEEPSIVIKIGDKKKVVYKVEIKSDKPIAYERFGSQSTACKTAMQNAEEYHSIIENYASQYSFNPNLIRAVIQAESFPPWEPEGTGDGGTSLGLMQISKDNLKVLIGSDWESKWMLPEENIKAGTKFLKEKETEVNNLGCKKEELDKILPASGIANATWRNALTIALYNGRTGIATCEKIKDNNNPDKPTFTREVHVPKVLAWYRVFAENYSMYYEYKTKGTLLPDDYCKPTKTGTGTIIKPPVEIVSCSDCSSISECLACIDYKFVSGIFETSN